MWYPEKGVFHPETGVPKKLISPHIKQGSKGVYECHYEHAPECQYSAENCGMIVTHICCAHIWVGCQYCLKKSWSGCTRGDHFETNHQASPEMTIMDLP